VRNLRWNGTVAKVLAIAVPALLLAGLAFDGVRWRVEVMALLAEGKIPDLGLWEAVPMLRPNGRYYLRPLLEHRSPYATIENPYGSKEDAATGAELFRTRCELCHGASAVAAVTHLNDGHFRHGGSDWGLYRSITRGVSGTAMRPQTVSEQEAWQLVTYIRRRAPGPGPLAEGRHSDSIPVLLARWRGVDGARLDRARANPADWLMYSGAYDGWRYTSLTQVSSTNVSRLRVQWILQLPSAAERVETSPVVVDGVMFATVPPSTVFAIDAGTGKVLWSYRRQMPDGLRLCCGQVNRGVAVSGSRVFVATLDAHLVALDAKTGAATWDAKLADYEAGYSATGAPLIVGNNVIVGIAGGEYGIRGFVDAYDAESGQRIWRFNTIPEPGEKGHETWGGESWRTGGAPTWLTGAYDPELGLVYWGVGNPAPAFNAGSRPGSNLFSNSVVALEAATGKLRWYFQFTPHDDHDWDSVQIPVLVDGTWQGRPRRLMLWANRNGFYYVLDRVTGEFLLARPFGKQTWAAGIDSSGTPILRSNTSPTMAGITVYPNATGATNWWSPAYSPQTKLLYVPGAEQGGIYTKTAVPFRRGESFMGSASQSLTGETAWTGVRAIQAESGKVAWDHRFAIAPGDSTRRPINGVMATAGGLLFTGDGSNLVALDAKTGRELWAFNTGGAMHAAPVVYQVDGAQVIAVAAGSAILAFGLN
jgi:alcohol dehydrogenase (cytochrome c)